MPQYPVEAVIGDLCDALNTASNAVLIAPPGAGKTTIVPPKLLQQKWCDGKVIVLSPRRIAARMAAERMAEIAGEPVGQSFGYVTRMDSKQSANTRVLVMTEGIFRNQIIADPELTGVSAVVFDEVHERNLDSDFGLSLALEAQAAFRPDLRLIAMSATLDGAAFARLMGDAAIIESAGKSWPLELLYAGRNAETRIEADIMRVTRAALAEQAGDILVFLPGAGEITRAAEQMDGRVGDAVIYPLHGSLDPAEQRAALRPDKDGRRKIILATNIAETSLTIEGVRVVIDSGLARRSRFDQAAGVTRLVTERVSQSAATQRAGRAARQGPGVAYRLWEEAGHGGLPPFDPPEILESDLSGLVLQCALWGEANPENLRWLDAPPAAALNEAGKMLRQLGGLDPHGGITAHGRELAKLPLPVNLAHMLVRAGRHGQQGDAALIALLMQDRNLGGGGVDLDVRLQRLRTDRGQKAVASRALAARLAKMVTAISPVQKPVSVGALVAMGFPERVSRRRDNKGENWISVMGRGLALVDEPQLANAEFLAVADLQGAASRARILAAAALDLAEIEALFGDRIESGTQVRFDPATGGVRTETGKRLGAIVLAKGQDADADPAAIAEALVAGVKQHGLDRLTWADTTTHLRQRAAFAGITTLSNAALIEAIDSWLPPLVLGKRRLSDVDMGALQQAMLDRLGWDGQQQLNRIAPAHFISPGGQTHYIDYAALAGPTVELRVQGLFGLSQHPTVGADRIPLVLSLTSPAGRPIQTTRDLPGFWTGSWADVAKEMRGRYPKHHWPDDPTQALASLKTKKKQGL
jgi:ATP-dependent helicase HrpB